QHDASRGLHDVELTRDAEVRKPSLEVFEIARYQRDDIDVGRRRRRALVLSDLGDDVGRARYGYAARDLCHQLGQPALVGGIDVGVEETDCDRIDAIDEGAGDAPPRARLVERA